MTFREFIPDDCLRRSLVRRFWNKVDRSSGCWKWKGRKHLHGYGGMSAATHSGKQAVYAHRISYLIHFGEIGDGMCVCHSCDNGECCNPGHLFLGSHAINMKDAASKKRIPYGEGHFAVKLSDVDVISARRMYACGGKSIAAISKLYGTPYRTMVSIVRGHSRTVATPI